MRYAMLLIVALLVWAPARADSVLDRVLGATGLDGDAVDILLGSAADAAFEALLNRTRVVNPRFESSFGASLVSMGITVEVRADKGTEQQTKIIEEAIQRTLKRRPDRALSATLNEKVLQQLMEDGLKLGLSQAGAVLVSSADEVKQETAQRREERANSEVYQGSMPPRGSIMRPALIIKWHWVPLAGFDHNSLWSAVTQRNVVTLTSQLAFTIQLVGSELKTAVCVIPVETRAVASGRQDATFSIPFTHAMMSKAAEALGAFLVQESLRWDQIALGRLRLQPAPVLTPDEALQRPVPAGLQVPKLIPAVGLSRYRVFAVFQRWAVLTCGQEEGLVGTSDADGNPIGSLVTIGGYSYKLTRTARRFSLISFEGLPLEAQMALSVPDASVSWSGMPAALPANNVPPAVTAPGGFIPD